MNTYNTNDGEISATQLLQQINSGLTDPKLLDKRDRQLCVELLVAEGYICHRNPHRSLGLFTISQMTVKIVLQIQCEGCF
jgi:hypothetical protein